MSAQQIAVCGWRGRLVFDAYLRLPDGVGTHKDATESYVDLAEIRGHSLPKTEKGWRLAGPECGLRSELWRLSSDSKHYFNGGWNLKRPDWFRMYDKGRWGFREEVYTQAKALNINDRDLLGGGLSTSIQTNDPDLLLSKELDPQALYLIRCHDPRLPLDQRIAKIGISADPEQRRKQLQTGSPYPLTVDYAVRGRRSTTALENIMLNFTRSNSMESDWRNFTYDDIEQIGGKIALYQMGYV